MDPKVRAAIAAAGESAWTPLTYPQAIWDEDQQRLISGAEVAEVPCTAFAARKGQAITARLIIRRVKDLNRKAAQGRDELFTSWRYHAQKTIKIIYPPAGTTRQASEIRRWIEAKAPVK